MTKAATLSPELLHVLETVPDLYLILSPDFTIITASDAYLKATHKKRGKIQGKSVFEVFPVKPALPNTDAITNLRRSLEWVLRHKQPHQIGLHRFDIYQPEEPSHFKEKYWDSSSSPILDSKGNIQYIIHKMEDVTEQVFTLKGEKQHDQQQQQTTSQQAITRAELIAARTDADLQREKLYSILMQAPALICIFEGPQHVFKLVNPPYQQLVGDRPLLGRPIAEAMPELEGQPIFGLLDRVYSTGVSVHAHEMKVQLDHDNTGGLGHNYYNFIYQSIHDLEGHIEGIMVFAYDVTDLVTSRQKVEQREQALQELNEELAIATEEVRAANEELSVTQFALQKLNQELEDRIAARTRQLQYSKAETEAQRNQLQQLFMQAPAPIVILGGPDLVFDLVNPAYQQIFPGRALLGKPLLKALPELKASPIPDILNKVYDTGETFVAQELPLMLSRHEGDPPEEIFWTFTYQARRNEVDAVDGVLVFAYDVTEQVKARHHIEKREKQAQDLAEKLKAANENLSASNLALQTLTQQQQQLVALVENSTDFIGLATPGGKGIYINPAGLKLVGLERTQVQEVNVMDFFHEEDKAFVEEVIQPSLAEKDRWVGEFRLRHFKTGESISVHYDSFSIKDPLTGALLGMASIIIDITERKKQEAALQALTRKFAATNEELSTANEQLTRTNVDLDNFIYAASHDLKAPIFNIEGLVRILIDSLPPQIIASQGLQGVTRMIEGSIERFKRTIEHLTEVTKLQKENNQDAVVVDISEVIQEVKLDLLPQLKAAGTQLQIKVDDCPAVRFSEKNLRSVVYNLVSNAVKYRSPDRAPSIQLHCRNEGKYTVLSVRDNGLGMDLRKGNKLFTMFGRLHDHVEGSGVGLYMVKKIVENADGRIKVESKVGVGSTFHVYFKR